MITESGGRGAEWDINPTGKEALNFGKPIDFLFIPQEGLISLDNLEITFDGRPRKTDNIELESQIQNVINTRKLQIEEQNKNITDPDKQKKFFDGSVARLYPFDIFYDGKNLKLPISASTYFTFVGTRHPDNVRFGFDRLGMMLSVSSFVTASSESSGEQIILLRRSARNEMYVGWDNCVAGSVSYNGSLENADITQMVKTEMEEELGLSEGEFRIEGVQGIVLNQSMVHPLICYQISASKPVESWKKNVGKDGEGQLITVPNTQYGLEAVILGIKTEFYNPPRPLTPGSVGNLLLYGRNKYGKAWFEEASSRLPKY